jgi:hypothetical protein
MMRDLDRELLEYDVVHGTDYEGNLQSYMEPYVGGCWVSAAEHFTLVYDLKQRITYLENVCDEQTRMLTGD